MIKCYKCGKMFLGIEGKEDTCSNCLKDIMGEDVKNDT